MDREFRRRFVVANAVVIFVIALGAATAVVALRSTQHDLDQAHAIDQRLIMIDHLRAETRELGLSARRYIMVGDLKDQQRVLAIVQGMRTERDQLAARSTLANGGLLEAELDEFVASLIHAMRFDDADPIVRMSKFEDELARIRSPLSTQFDNVISRERTRRDSLRSAVSLARNAQWAVIFASAFGALLVVGAAGGALRRLRGDAIPEPIEIPTASLGRVSGDEPTLLR